MECELERTANPGYFFSRSLFSGFPKNSFCPGLIVFSSSVVSVFFHPESPILPLLIKVDFESSERDC